MKTKGPHLQYQDALFLVLVLLVGASLLLGVLFAAHVRGRWHETEVERARYADRAARAEVAATVARTRAALLEVFGRTQFEPPDDEERAERVRELALREGWREWLIVSSRGNRLWNDNWERQLDPAVVEELAGDSPELVVLNQPHGSTLWMLFRLPISETDAVLVPIPPEILTAMSGGAENAGLTTVLDQHGATIARLLPTENDSMTEATRIQATGGGHAESLVPPSMRAPYLGSMNRYLPTSRHPTTVRDGDVIRSLIPVDSVGAYLVVERTLTGAGFALSTSLVASAAVLLYGVITWLFLGFRRSVGAQARAIAELSEQKNVLFGLLSHNLKNHLATIAAETHALPSSNRTLSSVDAASRVISDSLYYLQLREGTFQTPAVEPVDTEDIVEFLTMRGEREAAMRGVSLERGAVEHTQAATNLNLALDALERALLTVVNLATPESTVTIGVPPGDAAPTLSICYSGRPIPTERLTTLSPPLDDDENRVPRSGAIADLSLWVCREILWHLGASVRGKQSYGDLQCIVVSFPPPENELGRNY